MALFKKKPKMTAVPKQFDKAYAFHRMGKKELVKELVAYIQRYIAHHLNRANAAQKKAVYANIIALLVSESTQLSEADAHEVINEAATILAGGKAKKEEEKKESAFDKLKDLSEVERDALEDLKKFLGALGTEAANIEALINKVGELKRKTTEFMASAERLKFKAEGHVYEIRGIIEQLERHIREAVIKEDDLNKFIKSFLDELKTIEKDMKPAGNIMIDHIKLLSGGHTEEIPTGLDRDVADAIIRSPLMIRNATFVLALMPEEHLTDYGEKLILHVLTELAKNPNLNTHIDKYFKNIEELEKYIEEGERKHYTETLNDFMQDLRKLKDDMEKEIADGNPKEALKKANYFENDYSQILLKRKEEIIKFNDVCTETVLISRDIRNVTAHIIDNFIETLE